MAIRLRTAVDPGGNRYFIDTTTKNISFLQTAADLQKLGVKNNTFFLKLYNRNLVGVNPYDPAISKSMIKDIMMECFINPYYYLREIARIPEQGGAVGVGSGAMFKLHRGNLAAIYCFLNSIDYYLVLPRQCYKTFSVIQMLDWAYLFGTTNSLFTLMNKSQGDSDANLAKFKSTIDLLPVWMQQKYNFIETTEGIKIDKGTNNVRKIQNPVTGNQMETKPSAKTETSADNIGRGNTAPIQWSDETEFSSFMGTIIMAAGPGYVRAKETAERNGSIHCRIFTTTPGNIESEPVMSTNATRNNCCRFTEKFYDMDMDQVYKYIDKQSQNGICYILYYYRQIGMTEKYFKEMVKVLEHNKIKIKREVLLQRIRGTSDSPFDEDDLDAINNNRIEEPVDQIGLQNNQYFLRVYEKMNKDYPYIVSVDPSTGLGVNHDNTAINVIDPFNLRSIAVLVTPYTDTVETSKMIIELVTKYLPKCLLVIERNNLGVGIISLIGNTPVASRLYYDSTKVLEASGEDKLNAKGWLDTKPENRRYWGVTTVHKNREIMTKEILTYAVKNHKDRFIAPELIDDINNLCVKGSGRIEARAGSHDDVIMSYLIGCYVYQYGKNIHNWGIVKGMRPEIYKKVHEKNVTYTDIYNSLPEDIKSIFPNPTGGKIDLLRGEVNDDKESDNEYMNGFSNKNINNEIFNQIQTHQLNKSRKITQLDGSSVVVKNTKNVDNELENIANGNMKVDDDIMDIIDLLNS